MTKAIETRVKGEGRMLGKIGKTVRLLLILVSNWHALQGFAMMEQVVPEERDSLRSSEFSRVISDAQAYMHTTPYQTCLKAHIAWGVWDDFEGEFDIDVHIESEVRSGRIHALRVFLDTYRLPPSEEERAKGFKEGVLIPRDPMVLRNIFSVLAPFLYGNLWTPFSSYDEAVRIFKRVNFRRILPGSFRRDAEGHLIATVRRLVEQ